MDHFLFPMYIRISNRIFHIISGSSSALWRALTLVFPNICCQLLYTVPSIYSYSFKMYLLVLGIEPTP